MHVIEYILENDTLSKSQYNAIITLLYKKGNREDISNWRPISLLNTDYKIITKLLAERLKLFLPKLAHSDQKGFISGRNISDANRLVQDIIEYSDRNQLNSAVIFLDYKKAFDRVEWEWTIRCLQKFNFGQKFQSWGPQGFSGSGEKGYLFSGSWGALLIILGELGSKHILLGI